MTGKPHRIEIEIDDNKLPSYSDEFLAAAWHVAQWNPAPFPDKRAGELVERLSREIVRRWLRGVQPEVWKHKGSNHYWENLTRFAKYQPGTTEFDAGEWVLDPNQHIGGQDQTDESREAEA